jgi:hypothetical protein
MVPEREVLRPVFSPQQNPRHHDGSGDERRYKGQLRDDVRSDHCEECVACVDQAIPACLTHDCKEGRTSTLVVIICLI